MLTKHELIKLSEDDYSQFLKYYTEEQALTERRLAALKRTQAINPTWSGYDPMINEEVGIDIRIEEQEAVRGEYGILIDRLEVEQGRRQGLNQTIRMF